ncbi:MAG TPA: protein kinase, partial [Nitrospirota bacterium]|nr:protein kinase [Nitrospirota bacterium]
IAEGDVLSAARVLMEAGEFLNAAEYFDRAGDYPAAGEAYMKAREWDAAAAMFMKGGDEMRAAEAYAKSEHPREAAEIFIRLGQPGRAAELFESAGDFVEAADVYREAGQRAKEFAALQKVKPGDYGYNTAVMKMGEFFKGQGKLDLAEEKFVQAIGGAEADDTNLEMYYGLGTVYEESGRFEDAVKAYNRIQLIDYGYKDVDERIKSCRGRTNAAAAAATAPGAAQAGGADAAKRYTIMREVGRGGMGVVYKAKDNVLDRIIAIKLLPKSISDNPKAIKCFSAEARSAAQLNHTNIVTLYDFQQAGGRSFITMEYVEGVTLKKLMGMTDALQISKALKIIYQCCQGLDYAHKKGIIHRDIKPANIMISKQNIVKIMDFGLAKILGEETLTDTGKVSGTVLYMSPEQLKGEKLDRATDIYSLGLVLYELVTGRHPFPDGDPAYNHVHTVPRRPEELRPEVPAHLSGIVMRCIEKDRAKRFESALQLAMALREAAAG